MIVNFGDKSTEDVFHGIDSKFARRIPQALWSIAARKLDMLNAASDLRDLRIPLANRLEPLKGKWEGSYSIRINERYRIVFQWIEGNAKNVTIVDYH